MGCGCGANDENQLKNVDFPKEREKDEEEPKIIKYKLASEFEYSPEEFPNLTKTQF
jgi:hypothetical protein